MGAQPAQRMGRCMLPGRRVAAQGGGASGAGGVEVFATAPPLPHRFASGHSWELTSRHTSQLMAGVYEQTPCGFNCHVPAGSDQLEAYVLSPNQKGCRGQHLAQSSRGASLVVSSVCLLPMSSLTGRFSRAPSRFAGLLSPHFK